MLQEKVKRRNNKMNEMTSIVEDLKEKKLRETSVAGASVKSFHI